MDWSPDLINTVYLLGRTGADFELKYLANAQILGIVSLAVTTSKNETMWVSLEVWGELAETAAATVSGRTAGSKVSHFL